MTIATTQAERLALIKKIAERRTKMSNVKRKTRALKPKIKKSKNLKDMPLPKESNIFSGLMHLIMQNSTMVKPCTKPLVMTTIGTDRRWGKPSNYAKRTHKNLE